MRRKITRILLWILLIALLVLGLGFGIMVRTVNNHYYPDGIGTPSVADRITASKTLRCSYMIWDPYVKYDPATGKLSGIAYDYINTVAANNGLMIEWTAEVGIDQLAAHLDADKSDMFCMPCSPVPEYEAVLDFGGSFGKLPYYTYVPAASTLTAEQLETAHFVVVDGYIPLVETPKAYPQARITSLPMFTSMAELYDQLKYGKVDALVNEHVTALNYMRHNPSVIKRFSDTPAVVKTMSFPFKNNDTRMARFVEDTFGMQSPQNKALLEQLSVQYGLTDKALLTE